MSFFRKKQPLKVVKVEDCHQEDCKGCSDCSYRTVLSALDDMLIQTKKAVKQAKDVSTKINDTIPPMSRRKLAK